MPRISYPEPIVRLIESLKALPGVGPKSAERMAVWMLGDGREKGAVIAEAIAAASSGVGRCPDCGFFLVAGSGCPFCSDPHRRSDSVCVVEQPTDILPIERTGAFSGFYHSLGGRLSPLDNITPADIRISPLISRVKAGGVCEVILALGSDVEGEATANYIGSLLNAEEGLLVTRLAQGLPAGGGLENADELTLLRALDGRRDLRGGAN